MGFLNSIGHAISTGYHDIFGGGDSSGPITTTTTTMVQLRKPQNQNNTPQPQNGPQLNLTLQKPNVNPFGGPQVDASTLVKAKQVQDDQQDAPAPPSPPAPPKPNLFHRATSVVGNVGKAVAAPFINVGEDVSNTIGNTEVTVGKKLGFTPKTGVQTNEQQFGKSTLGIPTQEDTAKNFGLNAAQVALTVAAPGVDSAAEAAGTRLLPRFADTGLMKVGSRVVSNAGIGGTFNTLGGVERGDKPGELLKDFGEGAAAGAAGGAVFSGIPVLRKFVGNASAESLPARAAETTAETATDIAGPQTADELATGVKSANPNPTPEPAPITTEPANPATEPTAPGKPINVPDGGAVTPGDTSAIQQPLKLPVGTTEQPTLSPVAPNPAPVRTQPLGAPPLPAPVVDNTPAYVRKAAQEQADAQARQAAENDPNLGGESPLDRPTFMHNQDIKAVIADGEQQLNEFINEHPEATQAEIEQAQATIRSQVLDQIQKLQGARASINTDAAPAATAPPAPIPNPIEAAAAVAENKPVVQPLDNQGNPMQVTAKTADQQAIAAGVSPNPGAPVNPAEVASARAAETGAPTGDLKNARFQQAVVDNAKDPVFKHAFESDPIEKDGQPLSALNEQAIQKVQGMSLPELVQHYGTDYSEKTPVVSPGQYYEHLQALRQLEQFPGDPTAAEAAANALRAVNDYASESGRGLAATKVAYDNLPASMKVAYISKLVQKAGGDLSPAEMEKLYSAADLQGKFAATAQEAENKVSELAVNANQKDPAWAGQMKEAMAAEKEAQSALYDQNRNVVDIMQQNLPKSPLGDRLAQNARTMMLSSVGGRVFALTGTGFNAAQFLADNTLSSVFGKGINAINKVRGADGNSVKVSFARPTTLIKGAATGIKGLARDTFGSSPVKNVDQYLKKPIDSEYSHDATRYGFIGNHVTAPLRKLVRFGVGTHLALTKGVEDVSLEQSARQAARDIGVPKENMQGFVDWYKAHPPTNAAAEAKQAWLGVNNLHQNGVSNALGKFASAIDNLGKSANGKDGGIISGLAKQVRTVVIPFSHYMGGAVDKMLTDRNMLYNAYRIARARSPQELSDQLAHLTTNVGTAVGLGYGLAKAGVITNKDQDGNSYDGLYFHIGNRYIPVAIAGQAAMPIIMGATFHTSLNDGTKGSSWPARVIHTTTQMATGTTDNVLKAAGVAGTFGSTSGPSELFAGDSSRGAPEVVGTAIRQHIPGVFGDVNSKLDYTSLNPTSEKPLTKATVKNPATGRDVTDTTQTQINKTKAAIPFISQTLPRQPGEAAHDFIDRMLHSGQASGTQQQAAKDAKVAQDQSTADLAADIPDPNGKYDTKKGESFEGAVASRISNNEYNKAIPALQQKLTIYQGDKNVDPKTVKDLQDHIKELNVTKLYGNKGQQVRQLYLNTSLSDWRDMGDPTSDTYDPETYKLLYNYDTQLAKQGVSDAKGSNDKNKFTAKKDGTGGKGRSGASLIKDNTIGSTPNLGMVSLGDLAPRKVGTAAAIPTIQQIEPGQLIKKRAISVTAAR